MASIIDDTDDRSHRPQEHRSHPMRKSCSARLHPHPGEDESTALVINPNTVEPAEGMERCKVCDGLTIGRHYGAEVCGSCASFFRRTIGSSKSYQCTCRLPFRNKKKGCRHCRFKNCLNAGMDAKVVQAVKSFPQSDDTLLSQLLACRNRVYVSRGVLLRQMDAGRERNYRWREPDLGCGRSFEYLSHVESLGLTQYWTDFSRCFPHFKEGVSPTLLAKHFLAIWFKLEQIFATVSHGRIDEETCLSDYETTFRVTYESFYAVWSRFVQNANGFGDPSTLSTLTLENTAEVLHISRIVRRASLDNLEATAVIQFLIAYYEKEMFVDDASVKKFVNQVLRELHDHYKSTYHNYHERLGVIVSILGEFHRLISLNKQFQVQLSLYTKSGQGMQLDSQKEAVNTLHDLRRSAQI